MPYVFPGFVTKWYLWDPVRDDYVFEGAGNDGSLPAILCNGFLDIGENITGIDLKEDGNSDHNLRWLYKSVFNKYPSYQVGHRFQ